MNTNMNNKYYEMHAEVLDICEKNGIRMIPGKRVSSEIISGRESNGIKDFLLTPTDMETFLKLCADELKNKGYIVVKGKIKDNDVCRIFREDILAATVPALMNNPSGRHCPQFIIRGLTEENGMFSFTVNNRTVSFKTEMLTELERTDYMGSCVYMKNDLEAHLKDICGADDGANVPSPGYGVFSVNCTAEEFLEEAVRRGYMSEERISRFKEYTAWRKENRTENEIKYKEYQDVLLGLKQP